MKKSPILAVATVALALPSALSAHNAVAVCDPDGTIRVTTDYNHLSPVTVLGDGTATVTWLDGFTRTIALPACTPPAPPAPTPAPVPPVPEVTPEPAPPVVNPPAPKPRPKLRVVKRTITRAYACPAVGERSYSIRRTRVTWYRGGKVIRVKLSPARKVLGPVCTPPAVAG